MLDVERLKLTDEEIREHCVQDYFVSHEGRGTADAATAKALWGLVDDLTEGVEVEGNYFTYAVPLRKTLEKSLEAAGISRPGVPFHETIIYAYGEMKYTDASQD